MARRQPRDSTWASMAGRRPQSPRGGRGWEAAESRQGKARVTGAGHAQYLRATGDEALVDSEVEQWSRCEYPYVETLPREASLMSPCPPLTQPCGLCFPNVHPIPTNSSSRVSQLNY